MTAIQASRPLQVPDQRVGYQLSPQACQMAQRQLRVGELFDHGLTVNAIADGLGVSPKLVRTDLSAMGFPVAGVCNRGHGKPWNGACSVCGAARGIASRTRREATA